MSEYQRSRQKHRLATSIPIDADKLRMVLRRNFLTMVAASELTGKCSGWMSVVVHKKRIGYYALDELASAIGMRTDDLFNEIVDEQEWNRL